MQTKFEHFAANSLLGTDGSPPRRNGTFQFSQAWEERAFAIAIALSKKGHYEWEDFRQSLIASIGEWEAEHAPDERSWNYYQRWLLALERLATESDLIDLEELEQRTTALLQCQNETF